MPAGEVAEFELDQAEGVWREPETPAAPMSEEEKQHQAFLQGGGGLFPKEAAGDDDLSADPARMMIFQPGAGFEGQGEEGESEAAISRKGEVAPSH